MSGSDSKKKPHDRPPAVVKRDDPRAKWKSANELHKGDASLVGGNQGQARLVLDEVWVPEDLLWFWTLHRTCPVQHRSTAGFLKGKPLQQPHSRRASADNVSNRSPVNVAPKPTLSSLSAGTSPPKPRGRPVISGSKESTLKGVTPSSGSPGGPEGSLPGPDSGHPRSDRRGVGSRRTASGRSGQAPESHVAGTVATHVQGGTGRASGAKTAPDMQHTGGLQTEEARVPEGGRGTKAASTRRGSLPPAGSGEATRRQAATAAPSAAGSRSSSPQIAVRHGAPRPPASWSLLMDGMPGSSTPAVASAAPEAVQSVFGALPNAPGSGLSGPAIPAGLGGPGPAGPVASAGPLNPMVRGINPPLPPGIPKLPIASGRPKVPRLPVQGAYYQRRLDPTVQPAGLPPRGQHLPPLPQQRPAHPPPPPQPPPAQRQKVGQTKAHPAQEPTSLSVERIVVAIVAYMWADRRLTPESAQQRDSGLASNALPRNLGQPSRSLARACA
eukprot:jgi/Botrbrau1/23503/Bobra.106_1s0054.1